jgi:hypothetical protein
MRQSAAGMWRSGVGLLRLLLLCTRGLHGQAPSGAAQPDDSRSVVPQPQTTGVRDSAPKQFFRTVWSDQKTLWAGPFRMNGGQAVTSGQVAAQYSGPGEVEQARFPNRG